MKSIKAYSTNKTYSVRISNKQSVERVNQSVVFGLTASQPSKTFSKIFQKHLSIKQSVVSTKQQVVFHLV